jgi:hypothetical protein
MEINIMVKFYVEPQMTEQEFIELVDEVINCAREVETCYDWGSGIELAKERLVQARENLINAYNELAHEFRQ